MKIAYDEETDSLYLDWNEKPAADSREIADDVVIDFDDDGKVVGIDIQNASQFVDLTALKLKSWPGIIKRVKTPELMSHENK